MQIYALKNGGIISDSTLSPSSKLFPAPQYNPWTYLQTSSAFSRRQTLRQVCVRTSLSPLNRGDCGLHRRERCQDLRRREKGSSTTVCREYTALSHESRTFISETAGEFKVGEHTPAPYTVYLFKKVNLTVHCLLVISVDPRHPHYHGIAQHIFYVPSLS